MQTNLDSDQIDHASLNYRNLRYNFEFGKRRENVDVRYLDFVKAFDNINHGILCHHQLKHLDIGGKVGT